MAETGIPGVDSSMFDGLTEGQRRFVLAEVGHGKSIGTAVVLCLLLGGVGAHAMYLRQWGNAVVALLLSWTCIPLVLAFIEVFFIPGRVRRFNRMAVETAIVRARLIEGAGPVANAGPATAAQLPPLAGRDSEPRPRPSSRKLALAGVLVATLGVGAAGGAWLLLGPAAPVRVGSNADVPTLAPVASAAPAPPASQPLIADFDFRRVVVEPGLKGQRAGCHIENVGEGPIPVPLSSGGFSAMTWCRKNLVRMLFEVADRDAVLALKEGDEAFVEVVGAGAGGMPVVRFVGDELRAAPVIPLPSPPVAAVAAVAPSPPVAAAPPSDPSPRSAQPSYDCATAKTWAAKAICGDATLADKEKAMAAAYIEVRGRLDGPERARLVMEQTSWLATREACAEAGDPAACVADSLDSRARKLGEWGTPSKEPACNPAIDFDCPAKPSAAPPTKESLTTAEAVAPLRSALTGLKACFKIAVEGPEAPTEVVLSYTVTGEGRAVDIGVKPASLHGSPAEACAQRVVGGLTWPPFSGERKTVSVPFKLGKPRP